MRFFKAFINFCEKPWVNLSIGLIGLFLLFWFCFLYVDLDYVSAFFGYCACMFCSIFNYGVDQLIKNKRNSPRCGEDS